MIPILFEYDATDFTTHGLGDLMDCSECLVKQTDEGEYELSFRYPRTGPMFNELTIGRQIYAKANPWQQNQIFRIYGYEKEMGGFVTVNCQHISYDLSNIPVKAFKMTSNDKANAVLQRIKTYTTTLHPEYPAIPVTGYNLNDFTFYSDVTDSAQNNKGYFYLENPSTVRAAILDGDESVKGTFGGDLVFNNRTVKLLKAGNASSDSEAGKDRGVIIEYGIDLIDMTQEENISEMVTGVLPYYSYTNVNQQIIDEVVEEGSDASSSSDPYAVVTDEQCIVYGDVQYASGTFQTHKVMPLDLTSYFPDQAENTAPTKAQLNSKAQEWMTDEDGFGKPEISMTVSYAALGQDVRLHDLVRVRFVKMGIADVPSKVCGYTYDVLKELVTEVEIGKTKELAYLSFEDASRLRKGLIPPQRIQNHSITSEKYQAGSIGNTALSKSAVTSDKIQPYEIKTVNLGNKVITTVKIDDYAVEEVKVGQSAITSTKIKSGEVKTTNLGTGAVTYSKIGDWQIDTLKLNDCSITSTKLDGGSEGETRWYPPDIPEGEPGGEWIYLSPAVLEVKIGDYQVATMKLEYGLQEDIAGVLEVKRLVTNSIWSDSYGGTHAAFDEIDAGNAVFETLQNTKDFFYQYHLVSTNTAGYLHT